MTSYPSLYRLASHITDEMEKNMKPRLAGSVGKGGNNSANDVKLAQALLNVYLRREGKKALVISGRSDPETVSTIEAFQKGEMKLSKPDGRIAAGGHTFNALTAVLDGVLRDNQPLIKPAEGVVTFDSEGNEGGPYHSRILHVPSETSGLTLGRGYDMKLKTGTKISADLTKVGVDARTAMLISKAGGKFGNSARQFVIDNDLLDFLITPLVQKELFMTSYKEEENATKQFCLRKNFKEEYGSCDWDKLDDNIRQILVDLKFRGDYTVKSAQYIQMHVVNNDLDSFRKAVINKANWSNVPDDRFTRRKRFLENAGK